MFLIPSLYGDDDDLCKIAFEDEGLLDDAFDCNTTSLTNLTKESGRWNQTHADQYYCRIVYTKVQDII